MLVRGVHTPGFGAEWILPDSPDNEADYWTFPAAQSFVGNWGTRDVAYWPLAPISPSQYQAVDPNALRNTVQIKSPVQEGDWDRDQGMVCWVPA